MSMTPQETQRRVAALEARVQALDKKLTAVQSTSVQQSSPSPSQVVLGGLPSSLKSILNLGFAWVANQVNVMAGLGIVVDATGVRAKIKSGGGLSVDVDGLYSGVNPSDYIPQSLATAANDFLVASGAGAWIKNTLAQVKTLIGITDAANIEPGHKHSKLWASDGSPQGVDLDADGKVTIGTTLFIAIASGATATLNSTGTGNYCLYQLWHDGLVGELGLVGVASGDNDGSNFYFIPNTLYLSADDGCSGGLIIMAADAAGEIIFVTGGSDLTNKRAKFKANGLLNLSYVPVYATNILALAGGLVAGDVYKLATGEMRIVV